MVYQSKTHDKTILVGVLIRSRSLKTVNKELYIIKNYIGRTGCPYEPTEHVRR